MEAVCAAGHPGEVANALGSIARGAQRKALAESRKAVGFEISNSGFDGDSTLPHARAIDDSPDFPVAAILDDQAQSGGREILPNAIQQAGNIETGVLDLRPDIYRLEFEILREISLTGSQPEEDHQREKRDECEENGQGEKRIGFKTVWFRFSEEIRAMLARVGFFESPSTWQFD